MDALDYVRAVEHKCLVAAPREPVVLLEAQVEHLKGGAHPAVVDEDALTRGGQVIPHHLILPNLDTTVARLEEGRASAQARAPGTVRARVGYRQKEAPALRLMAHSHHLRGGGGRGDPAGGG